MVKTVKSATIIHTHMKGIGIVATTLLIVLLGVVSGCSSFGSKDSGAQEAPEINSPVRFKSDSAFYYLARQMAFDPRVPGSQASDECAQFIVSELQRHGADSVFVQEGTVVAYDGERLPIKNIMGSFNKDARSRILLVAHYDSRPWADSDPNQDNRIKPVPGANDGASGVAVLLEVARNLGQHKPAVGVDLLMVDAEDYGQSSGFSNHDETWALGTQYWVKNMPYAPDSLPKYAILLDMVGGVDAKFHREYYSNRYAPALVDKVWGIADRSGFGDRFINLDGGAVIDDHVYLNKAGIPAVDIIESKNDMTKSFPPTWHTLEDDMDNIDRSSLKAAGQVVLNVIYNEKP